MGGTSCSTTTCCKCDGKKGLISALAVAVAYAGLDFIVHHKLLGPIYQSNMHLWRTPADTASKMWWMWVNYVVFGLLFTCIYSKGYDATKAGPSQGLRFGFLMGLFYWGTSMMGGYAFHPWPDALFKAWFGFGLAEFTILGVLVGMLYKPKA